MNPPSGLISAPAAIFINVTRQLADKGRAVLVSSSDATELLGLCDRILVLWRGALAANLPTRGLTLDALLVAINGGQEPSP